MNAERAAAVTMRVAETDADLEDWRRVRLAVAPEERTATVAELRKQETPVRQLLLAVANGQVVGSGISDVSDLGGGFICPRVRPEARRHGVGTAILIALASHGEAQGHAKIVSVVEDDGSLAFAQRFGFVEIDREVQQIRKIGIEPQPVIPPGVDIIAVNDRPELWEQAYHRISETFADMALPTTLVVSLDDWKLYYATPPESSFVALVDGEIVGVASLRPDDDQPNRAETGYTAVRREWRGRGVAGALKRTTLAWAATHGIDELYTWTQRGNENMRAVNERLGYTYGLVSIRVEAELPLIPQGRAV